MKARPSHANFRKSGSELLFAKIYNAAQDNGDGHNPKQRGYLGRQPCLLL